MTSACAGYNSAMPTPAYLTGQLLIAMPALADPHFSHALVLVCKHDADGALGVIVNRASDYTLGQVLRQMDIGCENAELSAQSVLVGGPVSPENGFVLHDDGSAWGASLPIGDGLVLTSSRDVLEAMALGEGPPRSLVTLGYAGWGAGQLEEELLANSWLNVKADAELLFLLPFAQRWQAAAGRLGVDPSRLTDYSGRA